MRPFSICPTSFALVFNPQRTSKGYSLKEIAEMLELTLAAVKSNLHRARLALAIGWRNTWKPKPSAF
jgi:hypothetical protein